MATFVIEGTPVTKKNHQRIGRNKKTGAPFILQSRPHESWVSHAVLQLRYQWRGQPAIAQPVNLAAVVYRARNTGDLLNYLAAISDALEAAGVVENDRLIVSLNGSRMTKDDARPRVELQLEVI